MPSRLIIDRGYTIRARETQFWTWNWFGEGPNRGPVIFAASPKGSGQPHTARHTLRVLDLAKNRGGPGDQNAPEVFYSFTIKNDSEVDVAFELEIILFNDLPAQHF